MATTEAKVEEQQDGYKPTKVDSTKDTEVTDAIMQQSQQQSCCDTLTRAVNNTIESAFYKLGFTIGKCPMIVLILVVVILFVCMLGLGNLTVEQNIQNLWTPTDSPVWDENVFIDEYWRNEGSGLFLWIAESKSGEDDGNILTAAHIQEWYEFNIKLKTEVPTIDYEWTDDNGTAHSVTWSAFYQDYYPVEELQTLGTWAGKTVEHYTSKVIPFCKPAIFSPMEAQFQVPCAMLSIFDCFSEGAAFFPYDNYLSMTFFSKIAPANPYTFLRSSFDGMDMETVGDLLGPSCPIFDGSRLASGLLYGGETRADPANSTSRVTALKTWTTNVLMDSKYGMAKKIKIATGQCVYTASYGIDCPEITDDDMAEAKELYWDWLLKVIEWGLQEIEAAENDPDRLLRISMWNDRGGSDLLQEASSADFGLLFIAYFSMIVFASLTAFRPNNLFLSKSEASFFGVILVLMSVVGTLGVGGSFVALAPECVQVLPFIALGFGVDDMFVLMFAYKYRKNLSTQEMVAETARVAGSSVALTSMANCLAFVISTQMVLPSVANFAVFGALVVTLNFVSVIFGFTSILALVAQRQKGGHRDWSFLCCFADCTRYEAEQESASSTASNKLEDDNVSSLDPLFNILIQTPVRIFCVILCVILLIIGITGINAIQVGLPLEEIVPTGSYGMSFLEVYTKYYTTHRFGLYSDVDAPNQKSIDWPNRFEDWLEHTDNIHSISPNMYDGYDSHSFWARSFRDYLIKQKVSSSLSESGYALGDPYVREDEVVLRSSLCESDRLIYCPAVGVDYFYPSPLYMCLYSNADYVDDLCFDYLFTLLPDSFFVQYTWAHQVYITSWDTTAPNVTGLYVKSSSDDTNVYRKYPCDDVHCDGYIFQSEEDDCGDIDRCPWYLIDSEFNLVYIGDPTPTDPETSQPSGNGWKDPRTDRPAQISQNYLDFGVAWFDQTRPLNKFIFNDVDPITTFHYSGKGEYEWMLMRKLMGTSITAYRSVSMGSFVSPVECDAVLEATEICGAIRNEEHFGYINCGGIEEAAMDTNWWVGICNHNGTSSFSIAATKLESDTVTHISDEDSCDCQGTTSKQLSHLTQIRSNASGDCFNPPEAVSITCNQVTDCNSLSSCYEEFEEFVWDKGYNECNTTHLEQFDTDYETDGVALSAANNLAPCLFPHFDELSDCCKTSIKLQLLTDSTWFSCSDIDGYGGTEEVCNGNDRCSFDSTTSSCINDCYGTVFSDCSSIIYVNGTSNPAVITDYFGLSAMASPDSCCASSLAAVDVSHQECMIPRAGYWDYSTMKYDYSVCDNETLLNVTLCGDSYDNSDSFDISILSVDPTGQLACLYNNIDTLSDGCCKDAVQQINTNSFILSNECEMDTQYYCGSSFALGMMNPTCFDSIIDAAMSWPPTLSPKCFWSFAYCPSVGSWPVTKGNITATIPCDSGYNGVQTRLCQSVDNVADWSSQIDITNCSIMSCAAETDSYDQYWPQTVINAVATAQGGYNPLDGITQVSAALQATLSTPCSFADGNTFYARRKCELNPFNGLAEWKDPLVFCRPAILYEWTESIPFAMCDMLTSELTEGQMEGGNLIGAMPWGVIMGAPYTPEFIIIAAAQQYCEEALTNCVAFSYDSSLGMAFYFDYCGSIVTADSLHNGTIPMYVPYWGGQAYSAIPGANLDKFADSMTTYIAPLNLAQFTAEYCSAMSAVSPDEEFITAADAWSDDGIPHPFCFNNALWMYYVDPLGGAISQDSIEFSVPYADISINNTEIITTRNLISAKDLEDDQDAVDFILALRARLDEWKEDGFGVVPGGFIIMFFSQYIGVEGYMVTNLIYVTFAVIAVGFVFLLNPVAVLCCVLCNVMMIIEVYGFSHYVGLRINGVLVLNIVVAIGLTMEFTAHIGRAFVLTTHSGQISLNEGQNRMKQTLQEMFAPVTLGAITTIIGIAPIAAAKFNYFRLYYFNLYVIIVVFGWLNGVIFQPILLSFYPPKSFQVAKVQFIHKDKASVELGQNL